MRSGVAPVTCAPTLQQALMVIAAIVATARGTTTMAAEPEVELFGPAAGATGDNTSAVANSTATPPTTTPTLLSDAVLRPALATTNTRLANVTTTASTAALTSTRAGLASGGGNAFETWHLLLGICLLLALTLGALAVSWATERLRSGTHVPVAKCCTPRAMLGHTAVRARLECLAPAARVPGAGARRMLTGRGGRGSKPEKRQCIHVWRDSVHRVWTCRVAAFPVALTLIHSVAALMGAVCACTPARRHVCFDGLSAYVPICTGGAAHFVDGSRG